ncbi:hypothetical protein DI392_05465 [Vibrio albus]|uniref:Glycosyltransferase n=1 Tax=Vibrio albus TaxID=2200953 RepID=A0A2U3BCR8_9VIBR|nr:glycosyltransferase family 4 protein [Vibrio albus]PWI34555.1 hypothetical protein DI392_05465 [Vibrio albus]
MKVLHLVPDFSVISETFIYDLVFDLESMGIDNYIYTTCRVNEKERPFPKVYDAKTGYSDFYSKVVRNINRRVFKKFNRFKKEKLIDLVNELDVDVVHSHFNYFFEDIINLVNSGYKKKVIISAHGTDVLDKKLHSNASYKEKVNICSGFESVIFTVPSQFLKNELINNFEIDKEKIIVVPNCYTQNIIHNSCSDIDNDNPVYLINIGRLVTWKGQAYLIHLLRKLHDNGFTNVYLKIIGYGPLKDELQNLARSLNIESFIHFYDALPHKEVFEELESSHIYIQSSIKDPDTEQEESFGIAVLEALSVHLPVIVSNTGGLPETVLNISEPPYIQIVDIKSELYEATLNCLNLKRDNEKMKGYANKILTTFSKDKHRKTIRNLYIN